MLMMSTYFITEAKDKVERLGADSWCFVSNDPSKSPNFLAQCLTHHWNSVQGRHPHLTYHHVWSDNASHFRNASVMGMVQNWGKAFPDTILQWNFSAPGHGKGVCDGSC